MKRAIRYPFARRVDGSSVHVDAHVHGEAATCFGCDGVMVAYRGQKKAHYFGHKATCICDPDRALHTCAQLLCHRGFETAVAEQRPYALRWPCPDCGASRSVDLAKWMSAARIEATLVSGVRSDLGFEGRRPCAVEIVVTHDLEPETAARCAAAGLPVFRVLPTWETVGALLHGIDAASALHVDTTNCPGCVARRSRLAAEAAAALEKSKRRQELIRDTWSWLRALEPTPAPMRRWSRDAQDRELFPSLRARLWSQGEALLGLGFQQAREKPHLFFVSPPSGGVVFASLGGDDVIPVWEDESIRIWPKRAADGVAQTVERHLCKRGVLA